MIEDELKKTLVHSLFAMQAHQQRIMDELQNRIQNESLPSNEDETFEIFTTLVPRDKISDMNQNDFFEMDSGEDFIYLSPALSLSEIISKQPRTFTQPQGPFFLRCEYDRFQDICFKTYKGKVGEQEFRYELVPMYGYIERQEEILFRLAELYNINRPLIFSPYARRAVCINILNDVDADEFSLDDFQLEENELSDVFVFDHVLMWNVKINLPQNLLSGPVTSDTQHFIYSYDNVRRNTFILPLALYDQPANRLPDDSMEFVCSETFIEDKDYYKKIEITKPDSTRLPIGVEIFSNSCNFQRLLHKEHLRTRGDVNYILSALSQKDFSAEFDMYNKDKQPSMQIYSQRHQYQSSREEQFNQFVRYNSSAIIQVKFQGSGLFLTDYANFVLHFLKDHFPEYRWVGVH